MFNPCIEHCYHRYGKGYSSDCDDKCEYAKVVKEKKYLKKTWINLQELWVN